MIYRTGDILVYKPNKRYIGIIKKSNPLLVEWHDQIYLNQTHKSEYYNDVEVERLLSRCRPPTKKEKAKIIAEEL